MKDMVSMRKMRPESLARSETGAGPGAAVAGDDFFLAGNSASLTVVEFFITGNGENRFVTAKVEQSAYDMAVSVL